MNCGSTLWCPVHPHACGENGIRKRTEPRRNGTSPRMWGKPKGSRGTLGRCRYIPTHVGKTLEMPLSAGLHTVHPHACGGKQIHPLFKALVNRYIPTHVGENEVASVITTSNHGTSPRMWGKLRARCKSELARRYIPTHVGKTRCSGWSRCLNPVHPHACGENGPSTGHQHARFGTSPRMWGKRGRESRTTVVRRYIPTHVGKTATDHRESVVIAVHPHACGENAGGFGSRLSNAGTSPRMWGKPPHQGVQGDALRYIPTHVGKTSPNNGTSCP